MENIEREWSMEPYPNQLRDALALMSSAPLEALQALSELSEQNSVLSMVYMGDMYANARGIDRNLDNGIRWYERSMYLGSIEGGFRLSFELWYKDRKKDSVEILKDLANAQFGPAAFVLGSMYFDGEFVERDVKEAIKYWAIAEKNGHLLAKRRMSIFLRSGGQGILGRIRGYVKLASMVPQFVFISMKRPKSERVRGWASPNPS